MDMYMPGVTKQLLGTETIQMLRTQGVLAKICGLSANDIRESFIKAGADDFNLKPLPCKPDKLKQLLFQLVGSSKGNAVRLATIARVRVSRFYFMVQAETVSALLWASLIVMWNCRIHTGLLFC